MDNQLTTITAPTLTTLDRMHGITGRTPNGTALPMIYGAHPQAHRHIEDVSMARYTTDTYTMHVEYGEGTRELGQRMIAAIASAVTSHYIRWDAAGDFAPDLIVAGVAEDLDVHPHCVEGIAHWVGLMIDEWSDVHELPGALARTEGDWLDWAYAMITEVDDGSDPREALPR